MGRFIAIIETGRDNRLWPSMPDHYPVKCAEYETRDQALVAHPDAVVLGVADYREWHQRLASDHPCPLKAMSLAIVENSRELTAPKGLWRKIWEWLCKRF